MRRSVVLGMCRAGSLVAVLVPCFAIGYLSAVQALSVPGPFDLDQVFHLALAGTLMLLSVCFAVLIVRTSTVIGLMALGVVGFLAASSGALLSELFGPLALTIFVFATGALFVWTIALSWLAMGVSNKRIEQNARR